MCVVLCVKCVLGTSVRGGIWAVDTGYRTMNTVEELHSNTRGKYSDDTILEIVYVLIESICMKRYMARDNTTIVCCCTMSECMAHLSRNMKTRHTYKYINTVTEMIKEDCSNTNTGDTIE